jgi:DNA-binding FadR family transcriptional regulator
MIMSGSFTTKQKQFLDYTIRMRSNGKLQIPALSRISKELGISASTLREILEMARTLGLVEAHPRSGIELRPYSFSLPVIKSLEYAVMMDTKYFDEFSDLRIHLEKSYFPQAVRLLSEDDVKSMQDLVIKAKAKLSRNPAQIPHPEHRELHLSIYKNLQNDFVNSLLEAYWTIYEMVGLNVYTDLGYLIKVWNYHERIINQLQNRDFEKAFDLLVDHMELIKDIRIE